MLIVFLLLAWLILQSIAPRLSILHRPSTLPTRLSLTPFSLHLSSTSPSLLALPQRLLEWVPRLSRRGSGRERRTLAVWWDLGAVSALAGMVIAEGVLLVAAVRAVRALWTLAGNGAVDGALERPVKRAPLDTSGSSSTMPASSATDGLLLRPLIPSLSSLPLLAFSLAISQGFHELGHALAGASEGLPLLSAGIHLILLVLPTFYVSLPSSSSTLSFSPAQTDLRVAAAGVWHNLVLLGGAWVLSDAGAGWELRMGEVLGAVERREEGVVVAGVEKSSPLYPHLPRGTLITHLDDLELDASSASSDSPAQIWRDFLSPLPSTKADQYANLGWCLAEELFAPVGSGEGKRAECCSRLAVAETGANDTTTSSSIDDGQADPVLCFTTTSPSSAQACLNPLPFLSPSSRPPSSSSPSSSPASTPKRCLDSRSCTAPGPVCARIDEREKVLRIGVARPEQPGKGRGKDGEGKRETVLYQGQRAEVARQVTVTDLQPRCWFLPLGIEQTFERFYAAIVSLSLSLAFFNLLPLPHLDGSHILSFFLSSLSSFSSADYLPVTCTSPSASHDEDDGILAVVLRQLSKIRWSRQQGERWRKEVVERWARRWTMAIGGVCVVVTVVVEVVERLKGS